jgi:NADP-dependent aldehyde dehydrogenase
LPAATVQIFYQCSPEDGLRLAGDPRLGAIGFTGGETAGRAIKAAADASGIPAYFEMSGINPVVLLPGAIAERASELADDFCQSSHQAVGQFCTNPGLLVAVTGDGLDAFINRTIDVFRHSIHGPMLTANLPAKLNDAVTELESSGAKVLARSEAADGDGYHAQAAWLQIDAAAFLTHPAFFQREVFGPASLLVVADSPEQQLAVVEQLNSSLTGSIYSSHRGIDDAHYQPIARSLAPKVGRLLNDKMPTGVTVSPAMVHGGPFPAGGHPGFTAVGMPSSLQRFAARRCYDNVRAHRMPATLRDRNPNPDLWRQVDGVWAKG